MSLLLNNTRSCLSPLLKHRWCRSLITERIPLIPVRPSDRRESINLASASLTVAQNGSSTESQPIYMHEWTRASVSIRAKWSETESLGEAAAPSRMTVLTAVAAAVAAAE